MQDEINRKNILYRVTYAGLIVNVLLIIFKLIAGLIGKSSAMVADAIHSISDFVSDIVVFVFIGYASKPVDENHRYGHGKFETFATMVVSIILMLVALGIAWNSSLNIYKFINGEIIEKPGKIALYAAIISIVLKEFLFWYTYLTGKKMQSSLVIANAWHHRSDAYSSIATLIGIGGAIFLDTKWRVLDPIAAILVSIFIFYVAYKLFLPAFNELLEHSLPKEVRNEILNIVQAIPDVHNPHNLRTRRIGNIYSIELHIKVDPQMSVNHSHDITVQIENALKNKYGQGTHVVIHVEPL